MRQLTCTGPGVIEWRDVPRAALQSDLGALVRPIAVARCDIDPFLAHGFIPSKAPFALGHECVAEIVALGDAVRGLEVGQRAVLSFQLSCGTCPSCLAGHSGNCNLYPTLSDYGMQPLSGVEYGGALSELVWVPYANAMLHAIPGSADATAFASVSDNVLDGFRAVAPHLDAEPGSEVLIVHHGYPSIPLYAAQAALALGASRVDFASDDDAVLAHAARLGANPTKTDYLSRDKRYPIVVDAGLTNQGLEHAVRSTLPEGTLQSVSFYRGRGFNVPLGSMYTLGIRFFMGRAHAASLLPRVVPLVIEGKLRPQEVTTNIVGEADAPGAWLEAATKLVVRMDT
jgi:alcohol dehydrogenase